MIGTWLQKVFGPHWRTTLSALIAALAGFVVANPGDFAPLIVHMAQFVAFGGLVSLGIQAPDRKGPPNPPMQ